MITLSRSRRGWSSTMIACGVALATLAGMSRVSAQGPAPVGSAPSAAASVTKPPPAKPTPAAIAESKKKLASGQKLLKAKKWSEAQAELESSYELNPTVPALRGVAEAQEGAGKLSKAYATWERLLANHGKQLLGHERNAIDKHLKELAQKTGWLSLSVSQPGAAISIDGEPRGVAPVDAPIRLDAGEHRVRVTAPLHQPFEQVVNVAAGQSTALDAKLTLEVVTGTVLVREASGKPTKVVVDGVEVGTTPWDGNLAPGTYKIALVGEGLASAPRDVEIKLGDKLDVSLEAKALVGHLKIAAPEGAAVLIDGEKVGTGQVEKDLEPGEYDIEVQAAGFNKYESTVTIVAGKSIVEKPVLAPVVVAPVKPAEDPYAGVYGRLALHGFVGLRDGSDQSPACGDLPMTCDVGKPLGGGLGFQLGYAFGVVGIELSTAFAYDQSKTTHEFTGQPGDPGVGTSPTGALTGAYARKDSYEYTSFGALGGLGLRLTSRGESVRVTGSAGVGAIYRTTQLHRVSLDDQWDPHASAVAPALSFDLGLLFGATPGLKLSLGVMARVELGPELRVGAEPSIETANGEGRPALVTRGEQVLRTGAQIYVGPTLGLQFGH